MESVGRVALSDLSWVTRESRGWSNLKLTGLARLRWVTRWWRQGLSAGSPLGVSCHSCSAWSMHCC
jgi:hypothetical protein